MATEADRSARDRLDAAFAAEERRGLTVASAARSAAVFVVIVWIAFANPERGLGFAWVMGTASVFLVTGLAQLWLYARGIVPSTAPYLFILVESLGLAFLLLAPNPFAEVPVPPAMPLRREKTDVSLLAGLVSRGAQALRGRDAAIHVWTFA